jgi:hypothetical protein
MHVRTFVCLAGNIHGVALRANLRHSTWLQNCHKITCLLRLRALVGMGTPNVTVVVSRLRLGTLVKQDTLRKGYV